MFWNFLLEILKSFYFKFVYQAINWKSIIYNLVMNSKVKASDLPSLLGIQNFHNFHFKERAQKNDFP
jgi:hypothetical protein